MNDSVSKTHTSLSVHKSSNYSKNTVQLSLKLEIIIVIEYAKSQFSWVNIT